MRSKVVVGNWKLNGSLAGNESLLKALLREVPRDNPVACAVCRYVLVGHSERRTLFGETDAIAAEKYVAARKAGLTPVFCVGETLEEREGGGTQSVLARQVDALLHAYGAKGLERGIIAYEPVWAIGTGRTATAAQADEAHAFIRARIGAKEKAVAEALPILYGGSVKAANAAELFAMPNVDGGLVGGASLVAQEFVAIWRAAVARAG
jgi:triosephosphate isomerase